MNDGREYQPAHELLSQMIKAEVLPIVGLGDSSQTQNQEELAAAAVKDSVKDEMGEILLMPVSSFGLKHELLDRAAIVVEEKELVGSDEWPPVPSVGIAVL